MLEVLDDLKKRVKVSDLEPLWLCKSEPVCAFPPGKKMHANISVQIPSREQNLKYSLYNSK